MILEVLVVVLSSRRSSSCEVGEKAGSVHKAQLWEAGRERALQMFGAQLPGSAPSPPSQDGGQ